ncbi:MAG TPA: hypothetical protein VM577_07050, partial [Anaerovoracaceae bacterium]|nr:hypothetical protein [Anaerovoracaceae bacterium]
ELEARTEKPKRQVSSWSDTLKWSANINTTNWYIDNTNNQTIEYKGTWLDESASPSIISEDAYNWVKSITKPKPPVEDFCEDDGSLENVD